ncbi:uncharacterized protein CBL_00378 [Carabus blaptoides fortunei]
MICVTRLSKYHIIFVFISDINMEALSEFLQGYKDIVGSIASIVTIGQFLAGGFICKDIYKKGHTEGISSNPFVGGIVIGFLMLKYSVMLNDSAMLVVNSAAIFLNCLYLLFFFFYCQTRNEVVKAVFIGSAVIVVMLGYAKIESDELVEYRFGLIVTILMLTLIGSPLLEVQDVIKKQDASAIPFPIVLCGTVVSFLWLLYGIILMNDFMIFQNLIGFVLCAVQVVLCVIYPVGKVTKTE